METKNIPKRLDEIDVSQARRGRQGPFYAELMAIARKLVAENTKLKEDLGKAETCDVDRLPEGRSPMSREGAPCREMAAESLLDGSAPAFSKYWKD
jgi:hypothetical protein